MNAGQFVEQAPTADFFARPGHPYSAALLSATVDLSVDVGKPLPAIAGQPPLARGIRAVGIGVEVDESFVRGAASPLS